MAKKAKEIQFSAPNKVGVLSKITEAFKQGKVNIQHAAAWSEGSKAHFNIVTSDNGRAKKALKKLKISAKEKDVLVLSMKNKVGSLGRVAKKLAKAGVSISCLTATTSGKNTSVLIHTTNDAKAQRVV